MYILIATGLYPPDIGGPAEYAKRLEEEFARLGHTVRVVRYLGWEKKLPFGMRHACYFLRICAQALRAEGVVTLDTFSVAFPSVCATWLLRKKNIIRVSGDFLWESYVERTGDLLPLSRFYAQTPRLNFKERMTWWLMRFTFRHATHLAFNSEWQREMLTGAYHIERAKTSVILNFFGEKLPSAPPDGKTFVWAVRPIKLKNGENLNKAFADAKQKDPTISLDTSLTSHEELLKRLASCHAVILPSVSEVSPNFILDALRFGKPFILTHETGLYEMLADVGLFVDPLNPTDITEKILMLAGANTYEAYRRKSEAFSFTHSWEKIAREFLDLIEAKNK